MVEETINEWLNEFTNLDTDELHAYATSIEYNSDIISVLYSYFDEMHKYCKAVNPVAVCDVLFKYYRSSEPELKRFTLQFLPQILYSYLNAVAHSDKKTSRTMEALIIGIYNLEVVDENGHPKVMSFRIPSLAQSSIYHEPVSLAPASLTEAALKRLEQRDTQLVRWGPLQPADRLVAQNRLSIMSELLFCYNKHIAKLSKLSLEYLCKVSSKIVTQGFAKSNNSLNSYRRSSMNSSETSTMSAIVPPVLPRIVVSSSFLCQLLYNLYYAMFNGHKHESLQAIEEISLRATYQGLNDVILLTNAIKNCIYSLQAVQSEVAPMGISTNTPNNNIPSFKALSKSMITNASFRTKKLPEDIPIQDPKADDSQAVNLGAISEEKDDNVTAEIQPRRSLPKMAANFGKKTKEKIVIAVKSSSVSSIKNMGKTNSVVMNGGESETDEGIEMCGSDISNLAIADDVPSGSSTPFNARRGHTNGVISSVNSIDLEAARSLQMSAV